MGWLDLRALLQLEHRSSSGPLGVVLSNKMLTSSFQIGGVLGGELGLGGAGLGGAGGAGLGGELGLGGGEHKSLRLVRCWTWR